MNSDISSNQVIQMATLGYAKSARESELRKTARKPALKNVIRLIDEGKLPTSLRPLAENPPTRDEVKYLPLDVQTMSDELAMLDKGIESLPKIEKEVQTLQTQKDDWIREAIRLGITDKSKTANNLTYPMQLEAVQKSLSNISSGMDGFVKGSLNYATNNPDAIKKSIERLNQLRVEIQAPQPYQEAKSDIPARKKPVLNWLTDLKEQGSLEDRLLAKQVLDSAGIDAKRIFTEVDRQGMSLADKAVTEMRDKEAGSTTSQK